MELVEIRDLDGPNLFELQPAIKLELTISPGERLSGASRYRTGMLLGCEPASGPVDAFPSVIQALHRQLGLPEPAVGRRQLDLPGHHAVHFPWEWRETALGIAEASFALLNG